MIMFELDINPPKTTYSTNLRVITPKGLTKDGKPKKPFAGQYSGGKWKENERMFMTLMKPHAPDKPMEGAIHLVVKWTYPYRKADRKWIKEQSIHSCTTKPDNDNLIKGLKDVMTKLKFYHDDAQVARDDFHRMWGPKPGIFIALYNIN